MTHTRTLAHHTSTRTLWSTWPARLTTLVSALALTACSSMPGAYSQQGNNRGTKPATATAKSAQQAAPQAAGQTVIVAAKSGATDSTAGAGNRYITNEDLQDATGRPIDPDRPDAALILNGLDAEANLWDRVRQGFALPALDSELVAEHERYYASRPDYVQRMTERGNRYLYHVLQEVQQRGMPSELALLPFIESAFNPTAMSSARASGIWQFMPATGRDFSLKQNMFRDDRRDVLASTRAALDYLTRLHRMFGDWHLALAAYNWGEGNVQRAINRNISQGLPTDYLSLNMPAETRNYVPKLHAVRNIVGNPQRFGLRLTPIENHPYFVSVPLKRDMDVALAADLANMTLADFQALNPSMNKPVILAAGTPQILLPYDNASLFMKNLPRHAGPLASWTAWVAPRTMKTADVARLVGISESQLRELNRIPQRMLVKAGSTLLVPRSEHREQDVSESVADNAMISLAPDVPPVKRIYVKAGKRDTATSIARRYRLPASQVAQWNRTSPGTRFKRYQSVVLFVPVGQNVRNVAQASAPREQARASNRKATRVAIKGGKSRQVARATVRGGKATRVALAKTSSKASARNTKGRAQASNKRVRVAMAPN